MISDVFKSIEPQVVAAAKGGIRLRSDRKLSSRPLSNTSQPLNSDGFAAERHIRQLLKNALLKLNGFSPRSTATCIAYFYAGDDAAWPR